jgi:hypothetical protein
MQFQEESELQVCQNNFQQHATGSSSRTQVNKNMKKNAD